MAGKIANGSSESTASLTRDTLYTSYGPSQIKSIPNRIYAGNGIYNAFNDPIGSLASRRSLINSRLWHGVPQLTEEQMRLFEAAYSGHQFFFVTKLPAFMTTGIYKPGTNVNTHAQNLKAIIERCCKGFNGASSISINDAEQTDGNNGNKITHISGVRKEQSDISLELHEFAGLPLKNALETWLTGVFDIRSQHGNYLGNLGIDGGWCLANHTMSMLVVQVDPSWTEIQEAAYYCNMVPSEVDFSFFQYTKGNSEIVEHGAVNFNCNEIRCEQVNEAAIALMNNRILRYVQDTVYNTNASKPFSDRTMSDWKTAANAAKGDATYESQVFDK